jgi:hypothetical protein
MKNQKKAGQDDTAYRQVMCDKTERRHQPVRTALIRGEGILEMGEKMMTKRKKANNKDTKLPFIYRPITWLGSLEITSTNLASFLFGSMRHGGVL